MVPVHFSLDIGNMAAQLTIGLARCATAFALPIMN